MIGLHMRLTCMHKVDDHESGQFPLSKETLSCFTCQDTQNKLSGALFSATGGDRKGLIYQFFFVCWPLGKILDYTDDIIKLCTKSTSFAKNTSTNHVGHSPSDSLGNESVSIRRTSFWPWHSDSPATGAAARQSRR